MTPLSERSSASPRFPAPLALLLVVGLAMVPARAHAQEPVIPECADSAFVALRAIPWDFQTDAEQDRYMELYQRCSQARVAYYRRQAALAAAAPLAELAPSRPVGREPAEALVWSMLLPGGGQFYNDEPGKAVLFLFGAAAGWAALYHGMQPNNPDEVAIWGAGVAFGVHWGSLLDAVRSAR